MRDFDLLYSDRCPNSLSSLGIARTAARSSASSFSIFGSSRPIISDSRCTLMSLTLVVEDLAERVKKIQALLTSGNGIESRVSIQTQTKDIFTQLADRH